LYYLQKYTVNKVLEYGAYYEYSTVANSSDQNLKSGILVNSNITCHIAVSKLGHLLQAGYCWLTTLKRPIRVSLQ
jgi:hypothetical protein